MQQQVARQVALANGNGSADDLYAANWTRKHQKQQQLATSGRPVRGLPSQVFAMSGELSSSCSSLATRDSTSCESHFSCLLRGESKPPLCKLANDESCVGERSAENLQSVITIRQTKLRSDDQSPQRQTQQVCVDRFSASDNSNSSCELILSACKRSGSASDAPVAKLASRGQFCSEEELLFCRALQSKTAESAAAAANESEPDFDSDTESMRLRKSSKLLAAKQCKISAKHLQRHRHRLKQLAERQALFARLTRNATSAKQALGEPSAEAEAAARLQVESASDASAAPEANLAGARQAARSLLKKLARNSSGKRSAKPSLEICQRMQLQRQKLKQKQQLKANQKLHSAANSNKRTKQLQKCKSFKYEFSF